MRTDYHIFFPELIHTEVGRAVIGVNGLDNYQPEDFNVFLAVDLLQRTKLLSRRQTEAFEQQKCEYLYSKVIDLPLMEYKGKLADLFTQLYIEGDKIMDDSDYKADLSAMFNAVHFGDALPDNMPDVEEQRNAHMEISMARDKVNSAIEKELGIKVKTMGWPRLPNRQFDLSLPATLIIKPYTYDENELEKLKAIGAGIVKNYIYTREERRGVSCWIFTVDYRQELIPE